MLPHTSTVENNWIAACSMWLLQQQTSDDVTTSRTADQRGPKARQTTRATNHGEAHFRLVVSMRYTRSGSKIAPNKHLQKLGLCWSGRGRANGTLLRDGKYKSRLHLDTATTTTFDPSSCFFRSQAARSDKQPTPTKHHTEGGRAEKEDSLALDQVSKPLSQARSSCSRRGCSACKSRTRTNGDRNMTPRTKRQQTSATRAAGVSDEQTAV